MMKSVTSVLLIALAIPASGSVSAQTYGNTQNYEPYGDATMLVKHKERIRCQSDNQCTLIITRHCGIVVAANKDYSNQAYKFASENADQCFALRGYPSDIAAKCIRNEYFLAVPEQQN
jgi:hypothetical protein